MDNAREDRRRNQHQIWQEKDRLYTAHRPETYISPIVHCKTIHENNRMFFSSSVKMLAVDTWIS